MKVLLFKAELEEGRTSTITGSDETKLHLRDGIDLLGAFIIFDNYLAILLFFGADSMIGTFSVTVAFSESWVPELQPLNEKFDCKAVSL